VKDCSQFDQRRNDGAVIVVNFKRNVRFFGVFKIGTYQAKASFFVHSKLSDLQRESVQGRNKHDQQEIDKSRIRVRKALFRIILRNSCTTICGIS
jgi:hypothetical protein